MQLASDLEPTVGNLENAVDKEGSDDSLRDGDLRGLSPPFTPPAGSGPFPVMDVGRAQLNYDRFINDPKANVGIVKFNLVRQAGLPVK